MLFGVGGLVVVWALHVAWIARTARDRGRSIVGWAVLGAAVGVAGALAAREVLYAASDPDAGNASLLATLVAPLALVMIPMEIVAVGVGRLPAHAARRRRWRVHSARRGGARLELAPGPLVIQWNDTRDQVALADLVRADADGECVRLAWLHAGSEIEHVLMPMEKPDTRPGRLAQARALAAQIAAFRRSSAR
jgi:hypothetical protein